MLPLRMFILLPALILLQTIKGQDFEPAQPRSSRLLTKDFIRMHLQYPEQALNNKQEGEVKLSFTVDENGSVKELKVMESVSPSIDSATLDLFRLILWSPAKNMGAPVCSSHEFSIKYNIKRYKSWVKKRGYDRLPLPYQPVSKSIKIFSLKELDGQPAPLLAPQFQNLSTFLAEQLQMPEAAVKLNLTGVVKLRFVIERNGLPSNILVINPLGGGCTEEAIRVVQSLKWMPGIKDDQAVRCCYELKLSFSPPDELKSKQIPSQNNSGL